MGLSSPAAAALSDRLCELAAPGDLVLFAGAGASLRAGLPGWEAYLAFLATKADLYEPDVASLMKTRASQGQFLQAATLFKRTLMAPPGDKLKFLSEPFQQDRYEREALLPLTSLPFSAIVTTNFDTSLFDAWSTIRAQRGAGPPHQLELRQVKGAAYVREPFVLFLHGRASLPIQAEQMVLDEEDYKQCYADPAFTDGILELLSIRKCLFVGFSFRDPALQRILETWVARRGPALPSKHFALLPVSERELSARLTSLNVQVLTYESSSAHEALWDTFRSVAAALSSREPPVGPAVPGPYEGARSVLGIAYARATLGRNVLLPLRDVVVDGLILGLIAEAGEHRIQRGILLPELAKRLGLLEEEAQEVMVPSIERLVRVGACQVVVDEICETGTVKNSLSEQTLALARRAQLRTRLRSGVVIPEADLQVLARIIEDLVVARACDLAAHFSQPRLAALPGIESSVATVVGSEWPSPGSNKAVEAGILDLFLRPNEAEARVLADLGRVAFSLQLAMGHARSALTYVYTLPQRLYFDASILMPAIVHGHPLQKLYTQTVKRLADHSTYSSGSLVVLAPLEFLNEVIAHRVAAIQLVEELGLERPERLEREALLSGTENLNVFVGAYAAHVGRQHRKVSFATFLREHAPYGTEDELRRFLQKRGFTVQQLATGPRASWPRTYWDWFNELSAAYEADQRGTRRKLPVLVEHEAWQLARLHEDQKGGLRSVFVTADRRLGRAVAAIRQGTLADSLLEGLTLVNLVDLVIGLPVDHRALARLLWGIHAIDAEGKVRRYFTDLGLKKRGDLETLSLPQAVESTIEAIKKDQHGMENIPLFSNDLNDRNKLHDTMDRFEEQFYDNLAEAVRLREEQQARETPQEPPKVPRRKKGR